MIKNLGIKARDEKATSDYLVDLFVLAVRELSFNPEIGRSFPLEDKHFPKIHH